MKVVFCVCVEGEGKLTLSQSSKQNRKVSSFALMGFLLAFLVQYPSTSYKACVKGFKEAFQLNGLVPKYLTKHVFLKDVQVAASSNNACFSPHVKVVVVSKKRKVVEDDDADGFQCHSSENDDDDNTSSRFVESVQHRLTAFRFWCYEKNAEFMNMWIESGLRDHCLFRNTKRDLLFKDVYDVSHVLETFRLICLSVPACQRSKDVLYDHQIPYFHKVKEKEFEERFESNIGLQEVMNGVLIAKAGVNRCYGSSIDLDRWESIQNHYMVYPVLRGESVGLPQGHFIYQKNDPSSPLLPVVTYQGRKLDLFFSDHNGAIDFKVEQSMTLPKSMFQVTATPKPGPVSFPSPYIQNQSKVILVEAPNSFFFKKFSIDGGGILLRLKSEQQQIIQMSSAKKQNNSVDEGLRSGFQPSFSLATGDEDPKDKEDSDSVSEKSKEKEDEEEEKDEEENGQNDAGAKKLARYEARMRLLEKVRNLIKDFEKTKNSCVTTGVISDDAWLERWISMVNNQFTDKEGLLPEGVIGMFNFFSSDLLTDLKDFSPTEIHYFMAFKNYLSSSSQGSLGY